MCEQDVVMCFKLYGCLGIFVAEGECLFTVFARAFDLGQSCTRLLRSVLKWFTGGNDCASYSMLVEVGVSVLFLVALG